MLVPNFLYGTINEVKKNSNKIIRKIKKEIPFTEIIELNDCEMLDVINKNYIITTDCRPIITRNENRIYINILSFNLFMLHINKKIPDEIFEKFYDYCLKFPWSIFSILFNDEGTECLDYWFKKQKFTKLKKFLNKIVDYWDIFLKVGNNYSNYEEKSKYSFLELINSSTIFRAFWFIGEKVENLREIKKKGVTRDIIMNYIDNFRECKIEDLDHGE